MDKKPEIIKLLYFEDNQLNQVIAVNMLKDCGFDIDLASDPLVGIDMFIDNKYDAILMDIMMPEVDGFEVTELLRKIDEGVNIPIIAITANNYEINEEISSNAGFDAFFLKPVNYLEIGDFIKKILEERKTD